MPVSFGNDSPAFRKDVETLYESVKSLQAVADRWARASGKDCQAATRRAEAGISLANELQAMGLQHQHVTGGGSFADVLSTVAATLRNVHSWERDTAAASETRVAHAVQTRADEDSRRCKDARVRFGGCDDTWVTSLARSHAVRLENDGGVRRADKEFVSTKLAFETSRFELCAALNESEAAKSLALLELALATVAERLELFEQVHVIYRYIDT